MAHWFRTDTYFSIPTADVWFELKELLNITDDSFDKSITEFEFVDGKYDMNNRIYDDNGLSPTLKSCTDGALIKERKDRQVIQLNNDHKTYQDGRVYSTEGLSIAMNARGNNGWYTDEKEL